LQASSKNLEVLPFAYHNVGAIYYEKKMFQEASNYLIKSLELKTNNNPAENSNPVQHSALHH
jgi:Tfp pilus assembly protein PilF